MEASDCQEGVKSKRLTQSCVMLVLSPVSRLSPAHFFVAVMRRKSYGTEKDKDGSGVKRSALGR